MRKAGFSMRIASALLLLSPWTPVLSAPPATASASAALIANEADGTNWASYGRTYSEDHASPLHEIDGSNVGRLGLAWSLELPDIHNGATVPLAVDGVVYFTVGQSIVHAVDAQSGKLLWRYDPEVTKVAGRKLRITWGPRGIAYWAGRIYVGTTDGRLIAHRCARRPARLEHADRRSRQRDDDHGPAARVQRQGADRQRGQRVRCQSRLRDGLRCRDRCAGLALLHRPRQPGQRFRGRRHEDGGRDVDRRVVESRRRRPGVECADLRPAVQPRLHRHRQWWPVESQDPQSGRRRQPVPVLDRRARCRHRPLRLALPDDAGRDVGLQLVDGHHARHAADRGQAAAGDPARAEERFFLCHRSQRRQAAVGREVRQGHVGGARRSRDRPAGRGAECALRARPRADVAVDDGRAQLAADVVQRRNRSRLHTHARDDGRRSTTPA